MDQTTFDELVAEAVGHLYDSPYLQTHRLGQLLVGAPSGEVRGRALQRELLAAIEALRPPADASGSAHAWRTYRYLFFRYVQALNLPEVAEQLGVSDRQARRTYREALDALTSVLWDRYRSQGQSAPSADLVENEVRHVSAGGRERPIDLAEVVDGLRPILDPLARRRASSWAAELPLDLPRLSADRVVVRQILLNLCAVAFERGVRHLTLSAGAAGDAVAIEVVGDPVSPRPVVDERLAVTRRLVEAEGGALDALAGGARVSLPAVRRPAVLVIDDNPDVVAVFRRYLETAGVEVLEAADGPGGFAVAREARPSAITLDVMMAAQDGWETLQLLKNYPDTHDIPVLICSVLPEHDLAGFLGAAELLEKPVTRPALLAALARQGLPVQG